MTARRFRKSIAILLVSGLTRSSLKPAFAASSTDRPAVATPITGDATSMRTALLYNVRLLADQTLESAVPPLITAARSPEPEEARPARLALALLNDPRLLASVEPLLPHDAKPALDKIASKTAEASARPELRALMEEVRTELAPELESGAYDRAKADLARLFDEAYPGAEGAAFGALIEAPVAEEAPALAAPVPAEVTPSEAAGWRKDAEAGYKRLVKRQVNLRAKARDLETQLLGFSPPPAEAVEKGDIFEIGIAKLLRHPDHDVRVEAKELLVKRLTAELVVAWRVPTPENMSTLAHHLMLFASEHHGWDERKQVIMHWLEGSIKDAGMKDDGSFAAEVAEHLEIYHAMEGAHHPSGELVAVPEYQVEMIPDRPKARSAAKAILKRADALIEAGCEHLVELAKDYFKSLEERPKTPTVVSLPLPVAWAARTARRTFDGLYGAWVMTTELAVPSWFDCRAMIRRDLQGMATAGAPLEARIARALASALFLTLAAPLMVTIPLMLGFAAGWENGKKDVRREVLKAKRQLAEIGAGEAADTDEKMVK